MSAPIPAKMTFAVSARRVDAHGSLAQCKDAELVLETDLGGRTKTSANTSRSTTR